LAQVIETGSVGFTQTRYFTFAEPPARLELESGERLGPITIAYESYGQLNARRSNAVLVCHALSGDAHAAGIAVDADGPSAVELGLDGANPTASAKQDRKRIGWWDNMIGPGKAFDTDRYFVLSTNVIGGCRGSTGPTSTNPETGRPYGLSLPVITVGDMVSAQSALLHHLGIDCLLGVVGGSMGGMQALEWTVRYPDRVASCLPIATCARLSAQGIAFNEVGRRAIMADPNWNHGEYYDGEPPDAGLAIARMVGHITYLSDEAMHRKFGRRLRDRERYGYDFTSLDFEVESYLRYQGKSFTRRFDANSYLYMTKALDYFDLANGYGSLESALKRAKARFLVISFTSDWLYPSYQSQEMVRALKAIGADVTYYEIETGYGHDAFLLEDGVQTELISSFLAYTLDRIERGSR
jgi:homoserine O-acetyltransferase/O-succinyltransferase